MKKIIIQENQNKDIDKILSILTAIGVQFEEELDPDEVLVCPTLTDGAQEQAIEPENIDKVVTQSPFVKAQLSTKNQMILRNILAVLSGLGVIIVFILEKLGIM